MITIPIKTKDIKLSILYTSILFIMMDSSYYIFRLLKSGYTQYLDWDMYNFIAIGGSVFFSNLVFTIKEKNSKSKKIFGIISTINMLILGKIFFDIYLGFYNAMQNVSLAFMIAFAVTKIIEIILSKVLIKIKSNN